MSIFSLHHHHIFSSMLRIPLRLSQFILALPLIAIFRLINLPHIYICSYDIMLFIYLKIIEKFVYEFFIYIPKDYVFM